MIGVIDVEVQAANVSMPLYPVRAFVNSPSSIRLRNVPRRVGNWNITSVQIVAAYPDNSIKSVNCVLTGCVWVGTIEGCSVSGTSENGFTVFASGVDENGNAVNGYVLGKGLIEILEADGTINPDAPTYYVHLYDEEPEEPKEGDMYPTEDGYVIWQDGEAHGLGQKLTDAQMAAIDSEVDRRATKVHYNDSSTSSLNIFGQLEKASIPNIEDATSIEIGEGVTSIKFIAFANCTNLSSVTIPDTVTSIGSYAFTRTSITSLTIPSSVTSISEDMIVGNSVQTLIVEHGLQSIADYAFQAATNLVNVSLPDSVTSIGEGAFYECTSLPAITIPSSVSSVGEAAFYGCSSLTKIIVKGKTQAQAEALLATADVPAGCEITTENDATQEWVEDQGYLKSVPSGYATTQYVDSSVSPLSGAISSIQSVIPAQASPSNPLADKAYLASYLNNAMTRIKWQGNNDISYLLIGGEAASNTIPTYPYVTEITFGDLVTKIGNNVITNSGNLTSVTIPDSVTSIG